MIPLRLYRTAQALVMGSLGIFLLSKVMDGRILFYINQRFVILVLLGALGLMFLAQLALRERPEPGFVSHQADHPHHTAAAHARPGWALWLLALPVLIGLLVPEQPLGAGVLRNRGVNTATGLALRGSVELALALPPQQRTVQDWVRVYSQPSQDATAFDGQPVDVTGFVYHDPRLPDGQYIVGRFSIACCVADAVALGMIVDPGGLPAGEALPDNTWVRVRGTLRSAMFEGRLQPLVDAGQVEVVPAPEQPYLYP